ncbi:hypothetical protein HMPREF0766_12827 [Sphingobacterium spiritivorum ATCC 33861]|uniref:Uncharacterized protein n=1 Tax=Sphingobacterium spiritivorum ATCC 33861 TaxID=525373 RepID=D7VPA7_SPHSI|nr:hypothetical protein HMPREF0766_12827 [Sphingobacterium spiritivorum ATCC 33861]
MKKTLRCVSLARGSTVNILLKSPAEMNFLHLLLKKIKYG